ncbi:4-(cytidine 5'-diphospho)-2-C-methyl-D-erythritol kinase [Halarcobacter ebronensis]|uniref:4-diphosphocytidyl-2-C-methyl-D-erythritol kinase n=1 Tax=Halarcobacter ebronensis TaxID=1462615 RepID=A0A4Q0YIB2_9BACT|nr:4-(cytidine 5'-diphospho)-2-C-methyl-D-erythritol kinase [Halarcobacter ebronensis]RXJ68819.1 4-(cytidine 5'-diphospho)-2-C-methyl-D-erythritol kinase [Halarcobacter ebronensis]
MVRRSYAKVNVFLKIAGKRGDYHEIVSRFAIVPSLYDVISFDEGVFNDFTLVGNFGCETKKNTIYKTYLKLKELSSEVEEYFKKHCVIVDKTIPEFAGLGGGSSNAAIFMLMVNEVCSLNLSKDELTKIGVQIGADVPFFIYEYNSANVTGIGEIVEKFDEEPLDFEIITPKIECNTGKIFTSFRKNHYKEIDNKLKEKLLNMKSKDILLNYNIYEANDLFESSLDSYPELNEYNKKDWFFSGSGSSFFKVIDE